MSDLAGEIVAVRDRLITAFEATAVLPVLYADPRRRRNPDDPVQAALELCEAADSRFRRRDSTTRCPWLERLGWLHTAQGSLEAARSRFETELEIALSFADEDRRDRETIVRASYRLAALLRRSGSARRGWQLLDEHANEHKTASTASLRPLYIAERELCRWADGKGVDGHALDRLSAAGQFVAGVTAVSSGDIEAGVSSFADARALATADPDRRARVERLAAAYAVVLLGDSSSSPDQLPNILAVMAAIRALAAHADVNDRRTPLSRSIRYLHGALLRRLSDLREQSVGETALAVSLALKQSGIASFIRRHEGASDGPAGTNLVSTFRLLNSQLASRLTSGDPDAVDARLRLRQQVSNVFAQLADPAVPDQRAVSQVIANLAGAHVLDFVSVPGPEAGVEWFRTWLRPDGTTSIDRLNDPADGSFTAELADLPGVLAGEGQTPARLWKTLGDRLIPQALWDLGVDDHAQLVVSPFGALCGLPWAALRGVSSAGDRRSLVDVAVVSLAPTITTVTAKRRPLHRDADDALVRLVDNDPEYGSLDVECERYAWEALSVVPLGESVFLERLVDGQAGSVVQVSCHGAGSGLEQVIRLPQPLSAFSALQITWPETVILLSCHTGRAEIEESDAFGFVISCLAGSAGEVISGLQAIDDYPAGAIGARLINMLADQPAAPAARLLRSAQRSWLEEAGGWRPVREWGLLAAYTDRSPGRSTQ